MAKTIYTSFIIENQLLNIVINVTYYNNFLICMEIFIINFILFDINETINSLSILFNNIVNI